MSSKKGKRSNIGVFFMIAAMFIMLGIVANRGFLAIGFTFMIIGLASIGRPRVRFIDEMEERLEKEEIANAGDEDG